MSTNSTLGKPVALRAARIRSASMPARRRRQRQQGAPVAVVLDEQRVHGHGHRGLLEIGGLQQGLAARGCDIGAERARTVARAPASPARLAPAALPARRRRQAGLARALRRRAGKITAGAFEAGEFALLDLRLQQRGNLLGGSQHGFPAGAGYHHQVTHIRRAHVGAQTGVERHIGLRHRAQRRDACRSTDCARCTTRTAQAASSSIAAGQRSAAARRTQRDRPTADRRHVMDAKVRAAADAAARSASPLRRRPGRRSNTGRAAPGRESRTTAARRSRRSRSARRAGSVGQKRLIQSCWSAPLCSDCTNR